MKVTVDDALNLLFAARALDTASTAFTNRAHFVQKRDEMLELACRATAALSCKHERKVVEEAIERNYFDFVLRPTPPAQERDAGGEG